MFLKRNSSELIAMKHKLNYTVAVGRKLTTLLTFFILRTERAKAGWMAFRSRTFHAMYLEAGSVMFAGDAADPHSLKLFKPKNNHAK